MTALEEGPESVSRIEKKLQLTPVNSLPVSAHTLKVQTLEKKFPTSCLKTLSDLNNFSKKQPMIKKLSSSLTQEDSSSNEQQSPLFEVHNP